MPQWMDLLVELRSSPGEMDKLKDLFQLVKPSHKRHPCPSLCHAPFLL